MYNKFRSWFVLTFFVGLIFSSCQNFFTTSLGTVFARDPSDLVPSVTDGNAVEIAATVKNDPDASLAVLSDLSDLIAEGGSNQTTLVALALNVSASSSGVGGAFLQSTGPIANLLTDGDFSDPETQAELYSVIDDALAGLGNLSESADLLTNIFDEDADEPISVADIAETATAEEMAMAAIVLLSANATAAGSDGVGSYVEQLGEESSERTPSETLAIELASAASAKYASEGGTGPLAEMLAALNLTGA